MSDDKKPEAAPPPEEPQGRFAGLVPEAVRRAVLTGMGALFMTEEGIRNLVGEMKLPKDALGFLLQQAERTRVLGQVIHHMTENLNMMGMFYNAVPAMITNRLVGVAERKGETASQIWNVHRWEVRDDK